MTTEASPRSRQVDLDRGSSFASELERDAEHREKARSAKPLRRLVPYVLAYPGLIIAFAFFLIAASALTLQGPTSQTPTTLASSGFLLVAEFCP